MLTSQHGKQHKPMDAFSIVASTLFDHVPQDERPSVGAAAGVTTVLVLAALGVALLVQLA